MIGRMQTVVALDDAVDRHAVELLLTSTPRIDVVDYVDLATGLVNDAGDVIVVACDAYSPEVESYAELAIEACPQRPVVLLAPANGNGYMSHAFAHGADDIVILPDGRDSQAVVAAAPEVAFALEKALARRRGASRAATSSLGEMVCVLGLKGGSGKTLTVANLAVALGGTGQRVAVVDLDLQFGDVGLALGLAPERTMYDLVRAGGTLDAEKVAGFMVTHETGVRALLAPTRPDHASAVTPDFLARIYELLRETHDFVIVDTPANFTREVIGAVDTSSAVCMVATLDSLSLKNAKLGFETLERMEYEGGRVRFVLNRADGKAGLTPEDAVAITGHTPFIGVPSDREVARSINMGEPITLTGQSEPARAFRKLARAYVEDRKSVGVRKAVAKEPGQAPARRPRMRLFRRG